MSQQAEIDRHREQAARNQSLFREVNERIEDLAASASFLSFLCECADDSCDERVALTVEEYEGIRSDPNRFFVLAGHDVPEVEEIVDATDRYVVVAKLGVGGTFAERLDPRRRHRQRADGYPATTQSGK